MFKNASIFKITLPQPMLVATLNEALAANEFAPIGATQTLSVGWVPPRGHEHGAMVECVGFQMIMCLMIETKSVPTQAVTDRMNLWKKEIERQTGRKPGKKETREQMDDVRMALLPAAFPRRASVLVWIDAAKGLLVIDSASQSRTDEVTSALVKAIDGVIIEYHQTAVSPVAMMTSWLASNEALTTDERHGFDIGRSCQLKASDETKAVVTYKKHELDTEQIREHITGGKYATKLALTYSDRVSFTLTGGGVLAGLNFLDVVFEDSANKQDGSGDQFNADVTLLAGELGPLITNLHKCLVLQS